MIVSKNVILAGAAILQFAAPVYAQQAPRPAASKDRAVMRKAAAKSPATARASSGGGLAGSGNDGLVETDSQCDQCSANQTPGVRSFNDLKEIFENADPDDFQFTDLKKNPWMAVIIYQDPASKKVLGGFGDGEFDGMWADTHTPLMAIRFFEDQDVWLAKPKALSQVTFEGQAYADFEVTLNGNEACFADSNIDHGLRRTLRCRFADHRHQRLICASIVDQVGAYTEAQSWIGRTVAYLGFVPVK